MDPKENLMAQQMDGQIEGGICENERLRRALVFYADPKNYDQFGIPKDCSCRMKHHHPDMGRIAREALGL